MNTLLSNKRNVFFAFFIFTLFVIMSANTSAEEISEFKKKDDKKQRKKNITKMVKGVAKRLGNTPAVCRGSYIHPRFINDYLKGSFFRLWKDTLGEQMYPLSESESHVIRYLENS